MNARIDTRRNGVSSINVALGIWLIISPFVLGFTRYRAAEWNNIIAGIVVAVAAWSGPRWLNMALGIWMIISPFALGFATVPTLLWNNVILGALIATVGFLAGSERPATVHPGPPAP